MTKSKVFFILCLCFLGGVFAASFFQPKADAPRAHDNYYSIALLLLVISVAVFILNPKNRKTIVVLAAILFLAFGIWRTNASLDTAKNNLASEGLGPAEFIGTVAREPEISEQGQKIIVRGVIDAQSSYLDNWIGSLSGGKERKILINTDLFPAYQYGDELKVGCTLKKPENFSQNFNYQMYLAKDGIYRICNRPEISVIAKNKGNRVYSSILAIKNKFEEKLSAVFPDPEGAYLKGLLLGGSKRMPKDLADSFAKTGTSHTLAVSGYNVTIVAAFLMWLGIYLGLWRQQVFSFAVIGIVLFVLMTGAPSSAVRAGIMGALVIWAMKEGRLANSTNAILLAASAMLLVNPLLLSYDAGFQLSFLATIGIVQFSPLLEKFFFRKGRAPKLIQETVILTMSAIIFVLPIILNSFEKLPLVSPIANILILPAIPFIMGTGFAAGLAGFVFVPLGKLIGFVPYIFLKIELIIVQWLANLPWASVEVKNFGWVYITAYYFVLGGWLFFSKRKSRRMVSSAFESRA